MDNGPSLPSSELVMPDVWVAPSLACLGGAAVCAGLFRASSVCGPTSLLARVRARPGSCTPAQCDLVPLGARCRERLKGTDCDEAAAGQVLPDAALAPMVATVPPLFAAHVLIARRCKTLKSFEEMRASPLVLSLTGFGLGVLPLAQRGPQRCSRRWCACMYAHLHACTHARTHVCERGGIV